MPLDARSRHRLPYALRCVFMARELSVALVQLRALPDSVLFKKDGKVNYNRVFAEIAREVYKGSLKSASDFIDAIGASERLNLSSFQRMAAKEGERRRKVRDEEAKAKTLKAKRSK